MNLQLLPVSLLSHLLCTVLSKLGIGKLNEMSIYTFLQSLYADNDVNV